MFENKFNALRRGCSTVAIALALTLAGAGVGHAETKPVLFNIAPKNTAQALLEFSKQAGIQLLFPYDEATKFNAPALKGEFSREAALAKLLEGTNLEIAGVTDKTISLRVKSKSTEQSHNDTTQDVVEVIVTGTNIRGANPTSPARVMGRREIEDSGFSQVGDVIRSLPESFSGGQNPGVIGASSASIGNQNLTNGSTVNLRGVGTDGTLVLFNGRRMSGDSFFQGADVSAIPLSALQRIEIVTDGASAIYGSDAVAGVVNFVLRRNFEGAEVSARTGAATQGGASEKVFTALGGRTGADSFLLANLEYAEQGAVRADDRDFTKAAPADHWLLRPQTRKSLLVSAGRDFGGDARLSVDALITERRSATRSRRTATTTPTVGEVFTPSYNIASALEFSLPGDWNLRATAAASGSRNSTWSGTLLATASFTSRKNSVRYGEVTADGTLFTLPTGPVKAAIGGGFRREDYRNNRAPSSSYIEPTRDVAYLYGEALFPLVSPSNRPGLNALELNVSFRAEDYSDFGQSTNPKVGVRWLPTPDVTMRASWGTSFKAPSFTQMYQASIVAIYQANILGYSGTGTALVTSGGLTELTPETSESWTFGADWKPARWPGLKVTTTYFSIDYTDRVVQPIPNLAVGLSDPIYSSFVETPSSARLAEVLASADITYNYSGGSYDPTKVVAILHNTYQNASSQTVRGVDLGYRQNVQMGRHDIDLFANATWLTLQQQTVAAAPEQTLSGTLFNAPDVKARAGASWRRARWSATGTLNYVDDIRDTGVKPERRIASWTTMDASVAYRFEGPGVFGDGLKVVASVSNLFDRNPPIALSPATTNPGLTYDSTNASILGRFASLTIVKAW
ncbi:TonB-dependent receptor domain-containing protein [Asticcacaulis sp. W401b]|uniref:TonB-dependent receptor domain-containing protein n=1 Tax=Asticcacaulis sp. W401b TaxID=3388666 RepID=UPI003970D4FF